MFLRAWFNGRSIQGISRAVVEYEKESKSLGSFDNIETLSSLISTVLRRTKSMSTLPDILALLIGSDGL